MLLHFSVKDIALIDGAELAFEPGLTILTGETGAGKSILVESLLLLLGGRASSDAIRAGAPEGVVQAQFQLRGADAREVARLLEDLSLPPMENGALVLRRVISREGRHKQLVNGALATVAQLKAVAEPLVDFTGQHAHQALLRAGAQAQLLDAFGGHEALVYKMAIAYGHAKKAAAELSEVRTQASERDKRLDIIRFYLDEIERLDPQDGEDEKLESQLKKLRNAEGLRAAVSEAQELLVDGNDDALTRLQRAHASLERAAKDDDSLKPLCDSLAEACALVDDVGRTLGRTDIEADPQRQGAVEDRLDALKGLKRKHGGTLPLVLKARDDMATERTSLENAAERIEHLEEFLFACTAAATSLADELTAKRKVAAKKLASLVEVELRPLGMPAAKVEIRVEPSLAQADAVIVREDSRALSPTGSDRVEVLFSANAGIEPAPLSKVASGGELSRVLLAVKRSLLIKDPVPVSIFDEVDAGVGGAVADAIGEKLQAIASGRQVLVISHLPQIAARANQHLVVEKAIVKGKTVSRVRVLSESDRVEELARMLGGREITATTRRHAQELLKSGAASVESNKSAAKSSESDKSAPKSQPPKRARKTA